MPRSKFFRHSLLKKNHIILFGVILLTSIIPTALYLSKSLDSWQESITDRFFLKKTPSPGIIIVGISDGDISNIGQWPWPRRVYADFLSRVSNAEAIGIDVQFSEPSRFGVSDDTEFHDALLRFQNTVLVSEVNDRGNTIVAPLEVFSPPAPSGYGNVHSDHDGIVRFAKTSLGDAKSFSSLLVRDHEISQNFRIDYSGPSGTYPILSFSDVLDGRIPPRLFQDKIVLVGATAKSLHDTVKTPFGEMSGVEFHANTIGTITSNIRYWNFPRGATLLTIFLISFLIWFVFSFFLMIRFQLFLSFLIFATIGIVSILLFSFYIIIPVLYLLVATLFSTFTAVSFEYATESREKKFLRRVFHHYLAPDVVEELVENPSMVQLGGVAKKITILFSDIRGFTTISETLSPQELTNLLNEYLTAMTDIIMEHGGIVDKYIGDAIMAFWGAPLENPEQEKDAAQAAIAMNKKLDILNSDWGKRSYPRLEIGIGINTGTVVVGNMGSKKRFNYTVMGDEVNLASRLEGLTKYYGVKILMTGAVASAIRNEENLHLREIDLVKVKGKKDPKHIYELNEGSPLREDLLVRFNAGRNDYRSGNWEGAIKKFEAALKIHEDGPTRVLLERAREYIARPPHDWQGVYTFTSK